MTVVQTPFKVGDRVRRINVGWCAVKVGDVDVVESVSTLGIRLVGRLGDFVSANFEKVEEMNTRHKWADLIIAWANGAQIQFRMLGRDYVGEWIDVSSPAWDGFGQKVEYRIKPEPKPDYFRYARCVDWDKHVVPPHEAASMTYWSVTKSGQDNVKATFDGETGKLKAVEILK